MFRTSPSISRFQVAFILTTDASKVAVAAVLSQVQDGVERPVAFASGQMNRAEQI
jgi:hypothetical protein